MERMVDRLEGGCRIETDGVELFVSCIGIPTMTFNGPNALSNAIAYCDTLYYSYN